MTSRHALALIGVGALAWASVDAGAQHPDTPPPWDARSAAAYLDARLTWWARWPGAARDHQTACVSCHTALPYALARPALRSALGEAELPSAERRLVDDVITRVRSWRDVDPYYPDQQNGLPKTSESRGTEAIVNALVIATRDARDAAAMEREGQISDEARTAFENLWALQFKRGPLNGAWAWLNFHLEPWESDGGAYFGAALAAVAIGTEPGGYASSAGIQDGLQRLRGFLQRNLPAQNLLNRIALVWASGRVDGLLSADERQSVIDSVWAKQNADGGWSLARLGDWGGRGTRGDNTPLDTASDGYATGIVALALQVAGASRGESHVARALAWLARHQDPLTGMWASSSLNRTRDPKSDAAKFMSDAATGFAVLALTQGDRKR
jgi:squalene-hopene/tetraprenyl-beta-curcumene cyclase